MLAAKTFMPNTSTRIGISPRSGGTSPATAQQPSNPSCSGRIHERRRPKRAAVTSTIARRSFSDQGSDSAVARPMPVSDSPAARRYAGSAVAWKPNGRPWTK